MNSTKLKLTFGLALTLAAAPAVLTAQSTTSNLVLLRVDEAGTALEYNAQGSAHGQCMNNPGRGCVRLSGRSSITFRLVSDRNCGSGAKWELSGVQLGGEYSSGKPGHFGGLSLQAAADFNADANSGWARTNPASGREITMSAANTAAYDIWYRVTASCAGEPNDIEFDPRVENDGTGL